MNYLSWISQEVRLRMVCHGYHRKCAYECSVTDITGSAPRNDLSQDITGSAPRNDLSHISQEVRLGMIRHISQEVCL